MYFIQDMDVVVIVPWYFPAHVVFNLFIRLWRVIGGVLGKLPQRPLLKAADDEMAFKCEQYMEQDMEPVVRDNIEVF